LITALYFHGNQASTMGYMQKHPGLRKLDKSGRAAVQLIVTDDSFLDATALQAMNIHLPTGSQL